MASPDVLGQPALRPPRGLTPWAAAGVACAAAAVQWPVLAIPAVVTVVLLIIQQTGRSRAVVAALGGPLALVALARFTLVYAVPNVVSSGQASSEKQAVSLLREIWWGEDLARQQRLVDRDGNGAGEFLFLGEMLGRAPLPGGKTLPSPVLRSDAYVAHRTADGRPVYERDGYFYAVYLPGPGGMPRGEGQPDVDRGAAERVFLAYAWPTRTGVTGRKVYVLDQDERICESANAQGYSGLEKIPAADAALQGPRLDAARCGAGQDGATWTAWKHKQARVAAP